MEQEAAEQVIPLLEERLRIAKQRRETGRVRVTVTTGEESRLVEEVLRQRSVEVERVPIGRPVAEPPPVREEGDTLVIPVVEEVLVVERRLVLREEVRVRLRIEDRREAIPVTLRRQQAAIERLPPRPAPEARNDTEEASQMRTITGLFDSRPEAERAVETMVQEYGLDRDRVQVHAAGTENASAGTHARRDESHHGLLASLRSLFLPDQDRALYGEGVRRGGILVSAEVPEALVQQVSDAFERHGAVDLDAREAEWRAGGWTDDAQPDGARTDTGGGLIGGKAPGSSSTPDGMPAVNPDAADRGWTGGGGAIGSTAATRDAPEPSGIGSTYAGSHQVGVHGTDEDITKPINAGIASSPPVRPAGPAALAAAGAGSSLSAQRGSAGDAARAASVGNDGPGTGRGPAAGSAATGEAPMPGGGVASRDAIGAGTGGQTGAGRPSPAMAGSATPEATRNDETIPLVEERLRVGKRDVSHGSVRVRSYVVETPVQEQVTLRQDHVQVERRPVDRPLGETDRAGFQDRVIEATESAEEAVVDKTARVREEVVLRKTAEDRTETVRDTVRRTEVEVKDDRQRGATPPDRGPAR